MNPFWDVSDRDRNLILEIAALAGVVADEAFVPRARPFRDEFHARLRREVLPEPFVPLVEVMRHRRW